MEKLENRITLSSSLNWNYLAVFTVLLTALFEAHIGQIPGITSVPLVEGILGILLILALVNYMVRSTIKWIEFLVFSFTALLFVTGIFRQNIFPLVLGIFFISKPFLAFIGGLHLPLTRTQTNRILSFIGILSLITIGISALQFSGVPFNPLGFNLNSSGIIGIFDNPNKNAQIMVYGYLIYSNYPRSLAKTLLIPVFFAGILLTGSRQGLMFFLLLLFIQEIVMKKRWQLIWTSVPVIVLALVYYADQLLIRFFQLAIRIQSGEYFRLKAVIRSLELLWEHPLFGAGAGSFGGVVAFWYASPLQKALWEHWENYRFFPRTIDVYLPHLWAEIGIVGLAFFILILYKILKPFYKSRKTEKTAFSLLSLTAAIFLFSITSMALEASFFSIVIFLLLGANYVRKPELK